MTATEKLSAINFQWKLNGGNLKGMARKASSGFDSISSPNGFCQTSISLFHGFPLDEMLFLKTGDSRELHISHSVVVALSGVNLLAASDFLTFSCSFDKEKLQKPETFASILFWGQIIDCIGKLSLWNLIIGWRLIKHALTVSKVDEVSLDGTDNSSRGKTWRVAGEGTTVAR